MKIVHAFLLSLFITNLPLNGQSIVLSDFNNAGWDLYTGTGWSDGATLGLDFLTLNAPAVAPGNASFNKFINPITDLTGTTEFQLDLRLGIGNQANVMSFFVTDFETIYNWEFTASGVGLNTTTFTTLVFDLASPTLVSGSGVLDLDDLGQIGFAGGSFAETGLDVRVEFDNLIATIPEPTTASSLGFCLAVLAIRRSKNAIS